MIGECHLEPQSFHISTVRKNQDVRTELEETSISVQEVNELSQMPDIVSGHDFTFDCHCMYT